jgi:DNA primase
VQETEGVDFKGALELLAERYGVELAREQEDAGEAERRKRRERLLELLDRTTRYYERYLWESKEARRAREYLRERGLEEGVLREFRVGYAPSAWDRVQLASRQGGYSNRDIYDVGLAQRSQNGMLYDRFRSRIMFPLSDIRGRVLGFGARAMGEEQRPKYLNTADNDVYHKGLHLYGANLARPHAARAGEVILCEGYTDTIALHQAGMANAVGLMGTALTGEQVGELARMAHTVLLALDADSAGQEAMLRAYALAERRNLKLRVVPLPAGSDPADLIQREGPEVIGALVKESVPFERFSVERVLARGDDSSSEGKDRIIEELRPVFTEIRQNTVRTELIRMVSSRLALRDTLAEQRLLAPGDRSEGVEGRAIRTNGAQGPRVAGLPRREEAERAFLALCIASPEEGARALASLDVDESFDSELLRRAARWLLEGSLLEPFAQLAGGSRLDEDAELERLMAELVVEAGREEGHATMLEVQRLQLELARVERQIQRARGDASGDVGRLATRRAELKREFDTAYGRALEETGEGQG